MPSACSRTGWVTGAAVGDLAAAGVDQRLDDGGGQGLVDGAGVQAQHLQRLGGAHDRACGGAEGTAEHAHDGGGLQPVADDISDRDGEGLSREVDDVVPVAADVQ